MKIYQKVRRAIALHHPVKGYIPAITKMFLLFSTLNYLWTCRSPDYEPEKFYLPNNYIGWFLVIYTQNGSNRRYENGFRIYEIPQSGLLFTGFEVNTGWIDSELDRQFYYVENNKIVKKIPCYFMPDSTFVSKFKDSLVVFPLTYSGKGKYIVYPIYIDTLKNINKYDHERIPIEENQLDSILNKK